MVATSRVVLGRQGRIVIPAEIRRELALREGDELVALVDAGELLLLTREQLWARLRGAFKNVPAGVSLADELIAERREETRRDDPAV
jgi:AbrB family looped-hinge helix DNA binding protein